MGDVFSLNTMLRCAYDERAWGVPTAIEGLRCVLPMDAFPVPFSSDRCPGLRIVHLNAVLLTRFLSASSLYLKYTGIAARPAFEALMSSSVYI